MGTVEDMSDDDIVVQFTSAYSSTQAVFDSYWLGHRAVKIPTDFWALQEIIWETAPTVIIETGSFIGGSALFFASIFDLMSTYEPGPEAAAKSAGIVGEGRIISIDKDPYPNQPRHSRIEFLVGNAASEKMAAEVAVRVLGERRVMVVLDSDHTYDNVVAELAHYGPLVTPGCYLVVEDTAIIPGAREAAHEFVEASAGTFVVDKSREKHLLTYNPDGWIRRV